MMQNNITFTLTKAINPLKKRTFENSKVFFCWSNPLRSKPQTERTILIFTQTNY